MKSTKRTNLRFRDNTDSNLEKEYIDLNAEFKRVFIEEYLKNIEDKKMEIDIQNSFLICVFLCFLFHQMLIIF